MTPTWMWPFPLFFSLPLVSLVKYICCFCADGIALCTGTAGQRCTTLRRLVLHEKIYDEFVSKLVAGYSKLVPGNPLTPGTLLGPLHNKGGVKEYLDGIEEIKKQGGKVIYFNVKIIFSSPNLDRFCTEVA